MPTYANGKIYTIRSRSRPELVYVGSTTQALSVRFGEHKSRTCSSRQIIDVGDAYIELYENYPCAGKEELNRREGEVMRSMECVNKQVAGRTRQEYSEDNREEIKQARKQYYQDHSEERKQAAKQYRRDHRGELKQAAKQRYQDHREERNQYSKQYNQDHKEEINQYNRLYHQSKKIMQVCVCGTEYNLGHNGKKNKHYQSQKHQAHVQMIYKKLRGE